MHSFQTFFFFIKKIFILQLLVYTCEIIAAHESFDAWWSKKKYILVEKYIYKII